MKTLILAATALASAGMLSAPAAALTINLIDVGGVTGSPAEAGFRAAANYWESVITNNAVLNFEVGYQDLGPGILGGTSTSLYIVPTDFYQFFLSANSTSALDAAAVSSLPSLNGSGGVKAIVPGYIDVPGQTGIDPFTSRVVDSGDPISTDVALSSANVKALGFDVGGVDAQIFFSSTFGFDFNPSDGIMFTQYDFIGVAIHEIGHALGFLSGAEDFDYFAPFSAGSNIDGVWWAYAADMFRYSGAGDLDWRPGVDSYFSIDGGATPFQDGYFSTGSNYGDGYQASHWKNPGDCGEFRGVMNPYICNGLNAQVKALDLGLLDAIGWNFNIDVLDNLDYVFNTSAIPEPATWAMMVAGFGFVGFALRRQRRTEAKVATA